MSLGELGRVEIVFVLSSGIPITDWLDFYIAIMREITFSKYCDLLPRLPLEYQPKSGGEYEAKSQDDGLGGIAHLVSEVTKYLPS
jgi:hypothetical protein